MWGMQNVWPYVLLPSWSCNVKYISRDYEWSRGTLGIGAVEMAEHMYRYGRIAKKNGGAQTGGRRGFWDQVQYPYQTIHNFEQLWNRWHTEFLTTTT